MRTLSKFCCVHTTSRQLCVVAERPLPVKVGQAVQSDDPLPRILENFRTRRYERCRMIVGQFISARRVGKGGRPPGVDHVVLVAASLRALAQPMEPTAPPGIDVNGAHQALLLQILIQSACRSRPASRRYPAPRPTGLHWVHEIKHDGYRLIVRRKDASDQS